MNREYEEIEEKMYQAVCELINENGRCLRKEGWRKLLGEALANSFGSDLLVPND